MFLLRHPSECWDPSLFRQKMTSQVTTDMDPSLRWGDEVAL